MVEAAWRLAEQHGLAGISVAANDRGGRRWRNLAGRAARYFVAFTRSQKGRGHD